MGDELGFAIACQTKLHTVFNGLLYLIEKDVVKLVQLLVEVADTIKQYVRLAAVLQRELYERSQDRFQLLQRRGSLFARPIGCIICSSRVRS